MRHPYCLLILHTTLPTLSALVRTLSLYLQLCCRIVVGTVSRATSIVSAFYAEYSPAPADKTQNIVHGMAWYNVHSALQIPANGSLPRRLCSRQKRSMEPCRMQSVPTIPQRSERLHERQFHNVFSEQPVASSLTSLGHPAVFISAGNEPPDLPFSCALPKRARAHATRQSLIIGWLANTPAHQAKKQPTQISPPSSIHPVHPSSHRSIF